MAGYFENGICYAEQQQAIDAHFQSIQPTITNATTTIKHEYIKQTDLSWSLVKTSFSSNGSVTQNYSITAGTPIFSTCELPNDPTSNFLTGMELGWAVATVMVIVFSIRRTYRGF
jgi:hypothetical protein